MVELSPFRGYRPNPAVAEGDETICPVYDTLSEGEFEQYGQSPYNAAHFVARPHGASLDEFLRSAKESLDRALAERAYLQDDAASLYVYGIQYVPPADILEEIPLAQRRPEYLLLGLVGSLDIGTMRHGDVALHELTFADRVEERVALTDVSGMSFAPILAGYDDPSHRLNNRIEQLLGLDRRELKFSGRELPVTEGRLGATHHRIWRVDCPEVLEELRSIVRPMRLLILDGHHRFTAAARRSHDGNPSAPLVMVVDGHDRALQVLPWHRFLPEGRFASREFLRSVERVPEFHRRSLGPPTVNRALSDLADMREHHRRGFVLAAATGMWEVAGPDSDDVGADFDLLHAFLEDGLGIDPHLLEFHRSVRLALGRIADGAGGSAMLLPALTERGIEERAFGAGAVMAHKSTMFLPKVAEGLLFGPAEPADRAAIATR